MKSEPKIRFPEFDDSYSCSYLSDYLTVNTARNKDGAYSKEDVLSVSGEEGIVNQIQLLGRSYAGASVLDYHIVNPDDIVYTKSPLKASPFGIIKCNKGQSGIVSTLYAVYTPKESVLPSYVEDYFALDSRLNRYLKPIVRIGAKHDMKVSNSAVLEGEVSFPSLSEQKKIADFLSAYDKKISLQKERVETLKEQKKGLLQKMFPKKGETVPELRFPGFTGDWEQRKLGELSEKTFGGGTPNTSNNEYWNGNIPWFQSSDISEGKLFDIAPKKFISQDGLSKSAAQLIPENSIAIITRVGVGKLAFVPFSYTTSQDFLSLSRLKTEPFFTVYACYKKLQSELNAVQGTSIKGITKDELLAKQIMIPNYAEQQQIGAFFKHLDNLIALHQRKLETMQEIKKGLLQQMFV